MGDVRTTFSLNILRLSMFSCQDILASHGIYPLKNWSEVGVGDENGLEACFSYRDEKETFKHFAPNFPRGGEPSLADASRLFGAFVFRKSV